jgi:hypothetical protein
MNFEGVMYRLLNYNCTFDPSDLPRVRDADKANAVESSSRVVGIGHRANISLDEATRKVDQDLERGIPPALAAAFAVSLKHLKFDGLET